MILKKRAQLGWWASDDKRVTLRVVLKLECEVSHCEDKKADNYDKRCWVSMNQHYSDRQRQRWHLLQQTSRYSLLWRTSLRCIQKNPPRTKCADSTFTRTAVGHNHAQHKRHQHSILVTLTSLLKSREHQLELCHAIHGRRRGTNSLHSAPHRLYCK